MQERSWRPLIELMQGVELSGYSFGHLAPREPWRIRAAATPAGRVPYQVRFHLVRQGACWLQVDGEPVRLLTAGDAVVLVHGTAHQLSDVERTGGATRQTASVAAA